MCRGKLLSHYRRAEIQIHLAVFSVLAIFLTMDAKLDAVVLDDTPFNPIKFAHWVHTLKMLLKLAQFSAHYSPSLAENTSPQT